MTDSNAGDGRRAAAAATATDAATTTDAGTAATAATDAGTAATAATTTGTAAGAPPADIAALPFDKALAELQAVVGRLESGGLPLEESIALYERGVALHEHCVKLLGSAELRVQRLVESAGGRLSTLDLRPDDEEG